MGDVESPGCSNCIVRLYIHHGQTSDSVHNSIFPFQDYSFQCYFRQRWFDNRLRFDIRNITEVTLNNLFLSHIWKPNTYFLNGQRSNQHNITVPNLFVRIRDDGRVYLSRRCVYVQNIHCI